MSGAAAGRAMGGEGAGGLGGADCLVLENTTDGCSSDLQDVEFRLTVRLAAGRTKPLCYQGGCVVSRKQKASLNFCLWPHMTDTMTKVIVSVG